MAIVSVLLVAASAATAEPSKSPVLLAQVVAAEPAQAAEEGKIEHKPVERTPRGQIVVIRAQVQDPSRLFVPLVFARQAGSQRFLAYSMVDQGKRGFVARLPSAILDEGSFEYFIESRHDEGGATRYGSPAQPIVCVAYDPPPRPVQATFRTEEPGATIKVDENEVGKTPITVALGPGPHVIQAIAPDGRSTEQQLDVRPGRKLDLLIPLRAQVGGATSLGVTSDPSSARVFIDGAVVGATPYVGELSPGTHAVAVEMEGRHRQERQVVARQGRDVQLAFVMPAMPKDLALTVESVPPGALVSLDGKDRGRTPFLAPVPPGKHELVLRMPGRREVGTEFAMPKDKDLTLRLELPIAAGAAPRLTIASAPDGATVILDAKEVGLSPWSGEARLGPHNVKLHLAGYLAAERSVTVQANRDADLSFALERAPGPGRLRVETEPPDAIVTIDGHRAGEAPYSGELPSGEHSVEVSSEGYRSVGQQISLEPGQQVSLRIALVPAKGDNVPPLIGVNSSPEGAALYIDGKLIGPTPRKSPAAPGPHELRLILDGYKTWTAATKLPDKAGFELRVAVALKPVREAESHEAPAALELARSQYKRAEACYAAGDYVCAHQGYLAAYEYTRRPELLFNIAHSKRKLGNFKEAVGAYEGFLRDKPDAHPKLKSQAEQYIAFCQLMLTPGMQGAPVVAQQKPGAAEAAPQSQSPAGAPGATPPVLVLPIPSAPPATGALAGGSPVLAVALPEEDTQPPALTHQPVRKATRGASLRLAARIVDERSAVGDAQACWRNLFRIDFECVQLRPAGEDEYAATIPAAALIDGFAYYVEAYDTAGNGPARSGSPEAPHSVAVEELATPARVAVAEALEGQPKTEPAGYRPPEQLGSRAGPLLPAGDLQAQERRAWDVRAYVGAEWSSERYTEGVTRGRAGLQGTRMLPYGFMALAQADWRSSSQPYVLSPAVGNRSSFDEQRWDVVGAAGYELGTLLWPGRLTLEPLVGLHYLALRNDLSPADYLGVDLMARGGFRILPFLEARAEVAYTFPLTSSTPSSPLGRPLRDLAVRGGLSFPFGRYELEASYLGDFLAFSFVTRAAHGVALGFGSSF